MVTDMPQMGSNPLRPTSNIMGSNMKFTESITFKLIVINFIVFFIELLIPDIITLFGLTPSLAIKKGMIWQFLTFMFIHGSPSHVILNMFGLFMFGPRIEYELKSKKFLIFYFLCGIGSGLFHILISGINNILLIGASGAVFGVLTAFGLMFPKEIIYIQFFIPVPALVAIILFGFIELVYGITGVEPGVANFGHLGGMIVAFLLTKFFGFKKRRRIYFWEK